MAGICTIFVVGVALAFACWANASVDEVYHQHIRDFAAKVLQEADALRSRYGDVSRESPFVGAVVTGTLGIHKFFDNTRFMPLLQAEVDKTAQDILIYDIIGLSIQTHEVTVTVSIRVTLH